MAAFVPITGAVTGTTVYVNNKLVARDVTVTHPEINPMTADVQATGTLTMPIWELLENLQMTFNKIGVDMGLRSALRPGVTSIENRFTQTQTDANGKNKTVLCKAFCKGMTASIPGLSVEVGSASENEIPYTLTRYQLFIDGVEAILIDKLAGIVRIDGVNYTDGLAGL